MSNRNWNASPAKSEPSMHKEIDLLYQDVERLRLQLKTAVRGLEFYANKEIYEQKYEEIDDQVHSIIGNGFYPIWRDYGKTARQALKEINPQTDKSGSLKVDTSDVEIEIRGKQ